MDETTKPSPLKSIQHFLEKLVSNCLVFNECYILFQLKNVEIDKNMFLTICFSQLLTVGCLSFTVKNISSQKFALAPCI